MYEKVIINCRVAIFCKRRASFRDRSRRSTESVFLLRIVFTSSGHHIYQVSDTDKYTIKDISNLCKNKVYFGGQLVEKDRTEESLLKDLPKKRNRRKKITLMSPPTELPDDMEYKEEISTSRGKKYLFKGIGYKGMNMMTEIYSSELV